MKTIITEAVNDLSLMSQDSRYNEKICMYLTFFIINLVVYDKSVSLECLVDITFISSTGTSVIGSNVTMVQKTRIKKCEHI